MFAPNLTPVVPPGSQKGAPDSPQAPRKSNLELVMENFMNAQVQQNKDFANQNAQTNEMMKQMSSKLNVMATHNKMLETQISQVAQQQEETATPAGAFPGKPQPNPKGHANAITLRNGTELDGSVNPRLQNTAMYQNFGKATKMVTIDDQPEEQNPHIDDSLRECLALTPNPIPCPKKPGI